MKKISDSPIVRCNDPIDIGNVRIRNRIARSTIAGIADRKLGEVLEQRIGLEETFAKGGEALIISSHVPIRADRRVLPNYATIDNADCIHERRRMVDAVHKYETKYLLH